MTNRDSVVVFAQDGKFYIKFPYNERVITKIKNSIPEVRFSRPLLAWVAPFRSLPEVLEFVASSGATMDWGSYDYKDVFDQYGNYSGGVPKPHIFERVGKNKSLVAITFPYHPELFSATSNLPCASKTTTKKYGTHWVVPTSDASQILNYIDRYKAECSTELRAKLETLADNQAALMAKSWSIEPEESYDFYHNEDRALYSFQKAASEYLLDTKRCILGEKMGAGKAQPLDEPVLTPQGWSTMGQLSVGSEVIGSNGKATKVVAIHPQGVTDLYAVEFKNGTVVRCSGEHLWTLSNASGTSYTVSTRQLFNEDVITYRSGHREYSKKLKLVQVNKDNTKNYRFRTPVVKPIEFKSTETLPLDSYVLGVLLGGGGLSTGSIHLTTADSFILKEVVSLCPHITSAMKSGRYGFRLNGLMSYVKDSLPELLGSRAWEKSIPGVYMTGSVEQRLALLQGLMDTDDSPSRKTGGVEFCSTSATLVEGVRDLALSLGGSTGKIRERVTSYTYKGEKLQGRPSFRVNFKLPEGMNPFRLPRKAEAYIQSTKYKELNSLVRVTRLDPTETMCITVEAADGLYVTTGYVLTHNSSTSISSLGTANAFPALVVVPKSAKFVWNDYELPVWMSQKSTQVLSGTKANEEITADVVIINYDILWHWKDKLSEVGFRCIIADEAHALANPAAKRTQAAKQICDGVEYVWFLTGTALTNRPTELIGVLDALGVLQTLFVNASTFKNRYEADRGVVSNVEELTRILRGNCFIRRASEDLHAPIPVVRSFLPVDTDASVMRDYKEAEKDIVEFVARKAAEVAEELGEDPHSAAVRARLRAQAGEVMVRLSRLRKLAGEAKIPGTIKFLDEYMAQYPDEKILLFGYHRDNLQAYQKHFKCKIIQGGVSDADRAAAIRGIQEGDDRIVCLQIRAAGEALTLTAAATCVFTEQDWSPMRMLQAEARAARLGQTSNVMVFFTVADDTIDLKLFNTLQSKYATCLAIMDGKSPDTLTYIESSTEDELLNAILEKYNG